MRETKCYLSLSKFMSYPNKDVLFLISLTIASQLNGKPGVVPNRADLDMTK